MNESFDYLMKPENNYPGTNVDEIRQINDFEQMILNVEDEIKIKEIKLNKLRLEIMDININTTNPEDTIKIMKADNLEGEILDLTIEKQLIEEKMKNSKRKIGN